MNRNVDKIIAMAEESVKKHEIAPGKYRRWLWQSEKGNRNLDSSEYGCADAANILYIIGKFPRDPEVRKACIDELQPRRRKNAKVRQAAQRRPRIRQRLIFRLRQSSCGGRVLVSASLRGSPKRA